MKYTKKEQKTLMSIIYEVQKRSTVTINRQREQPLDGIIVNSFQYRLRVAHKSGRRSGSHTT